MRILLLSVDFPPAVGGIQNLLGNLAEGLAGSHDVCVIAPRRRGSAAWDLGQRYAITRAPAAAIWPFVMCAFLGAAIWSAIRRRPQVVICGHVLLGPVSWLLARLCGARLVVMAYALEIRAPRMRRLAGWTLRRAGAVATISDFSRRAVLAHGVAPERIVVIHPGAATPGTFPVPPTPASPTPERIILTVARLAELYKGHDMVIRAMPLILAREPKARYVIVGDGPLRPYLQRLARSVGVARSVTFVGELSSASLDPWYARADVFALLSRESPSDGGAEGYGLAFIEAGARGIPVVGGDSGGVPDAVLDDVTGLLVDPNDPAAIAEAILRVLGDHALAQRLGERGRERALNELSWPNFVSAFQEVLETAAAPVAAVRPAGSPGA